MSPSPLVRSLGSVAAALLVAGCGAATSGSGGAHADELHVVATTSVLGDVVTHIVGDAGRVDTLIAPGVDPHSYEPSAAETALVRDADLVVANGLQLEERLLDVLAAAEADGVPIVRVAEQVDPLPFSQADEHAEHLEEGTEHGGDEHGHDEHGELDPHVWFDPVRMAQAVTVIADRLGAVAPAAADEISGSAAAYREQLLATHERVERILSAVPPDDRELITNHDNLGYLAARYGFEVVGTVIPGGSTLADPSSRDLAALADTVRRTGTPVIFTETVAPDRLARAVSAEVGEEVAVVALHTDALGPPGSDAGTYLGLLETNARRIADALGG